MRQRSRAVVLLLVALAALAPSAYCARGKPAPAPPPPPPPPPSLLDAVKAVAVSAAAKLPSRAAFLEFGVTVSRAALHLASSAVSASRKVTTALTLQLAAVASASPYKAPAAALAARLVERLQKPSWSTPLAVMVLFALFVRTMRSPRFAGGKPYARAALCTAFVNWLSFSFIVNSLATVVVAILTMLSLVAAHPMTTLFLALAANGNELRRFAAYLPARRKRATFASASAADSEPARAVAAAPAAAPAARISSTATPEASKVKPITPVPGGAKTSPAVAARK